MKPSWKTTEITSAVGWEGYEQGTQQDRCVVLEDTKSKKYRGSRPDIQVHETGESGDKYLI